MRTLVVYGTKSGCTAGIAEQVAQTLRARGAQAEVFAAEHAPDPTAFDAVVAGSGVRAGQWHGAARAWVEAHAEALKTRPVALFTCGLMIREDDKADEVRAYTDALIEATGITPVDVGLFAGWNEPKSFSFPERTVLKLMKAEQGDFRDMSAVAEWTERIAPLLSA